jgi:hypothetical protein
MITSSHSKLNAAFSRRSFFGRAAVASGAVLVGSSVPEQLSAQEEGLPGLCDYPLPIPHITSPPGMHFYHAAPVSTGADPSLIFNFKGFIGQADLKLTGTGIDLDTGATAAYQFHTDTRFMSGVFVGTDQVERHASFAMV